MDHQASKSKYQAEQQLFSPMTFGALEDNASPSFNHTKEFDNSAQTTKKHPNYEIGSMSQKKPVINNEDDEDCRAIPFIKFVPEEGKFELDPEAEAFLKSIVDTKLGVVAVCGKYRTGKSYLLNKLFVEQYFQKKQRDPKGVFQVSPTINACTKGLWLWKKVIHMQNPSSPDSPPQAMIVVDTEGLGAYDEDENHDAKIFLLALLMSSLLIYNSVGTIDENALNSLSLVINLSKKIQLKSGNEQSTDDVDQLAKMFPTFLWVLRDFALKLVDGEGNKITPKQYLEGALREQKGCSEAAEAKNRVRRMLTHFFHERDCCTLVRPTEQEKNLQTLIKLPESELRQEFIEQMNRLKLKVQAKAKAKMMNGHALNGPMLVELANSYIKALNDGEVPVIENAWTNVCHFEQERSFKEAQMCYQTQILSRLKLNKDPNIDIKLTLKQIREQAFNVLKKDFIGELKQLETYKEKLNQDLKIHAKAAIKDIQVRQDEHMKQLINARIELDLESKVRRGIGCSHNQLQDFNQLLSYSEEILGKLKEENPLLSSERLEYLFRSILMRDRLPKLMDSVHTQHCKTPSTASLRTLEQQLRLADEETTRLKDERAQLRNQLWEKNALDERERQERMTREKVLEIRLQEMENKHNQALQQLKYYRAREMREEGCQTEVSVQMAQVQTDKQEEVGASNMMHQQKKSQQAPSYMEQNLRLLQDILNILNTNSANNNTMIMDQPQVTEIIKNNQVLSSAIDQAEKRCGHLEKKIEKKLKYENLIKNCQRLECKECNKLYTPALFTQHFTHCKQRVSNPGAVMPISGETSVLMSSRKSSEVNYQHYVVSSCNNDVIIETPVSQQTDEYQMFEGGCNEPVESISTPPLNSFNEFLRFQQKHNIPITTQTSQIFQAKVVNINLFQSQANSINAINSPYFKGGMTQPSQNSTINGPEMLNIDFQVLFTSNLGLQMLRVNKTVQEVKNCMSRIQRRMIHSPSEQSQIARQIIELDLASQGHNVQKISEIVESFFALIHQRLVDNNIQLNKHVIVEDIDGVQEPQHYYVNEVVDFFNLQQFITEPGHVRPFDLNQAESIPSKKKLYQGNDDEEEVIMQTPYEEDEGNANYNKISRQTSSAIQMSKINVMQADRIRILQDNSFTHSISAHQIHPQPNQQMITTMHLDGDQSIDNNSALHMVSFFSVEDEDQQQLILKRNLNLGKEVQADLDTSSIENFANRLAANHPTQDDLEVDDFSSSQNSIQTREFQVVSAKGGTGHYGVHPFGQIQNQLYQNPTTHAAFMQTAGPRGLAGAGRNDLQNFISQMTGNDGRIAKPGFIQRAQTFKILQNAGNYHDIMKQSTIPGRRGFPDRRLNQQRTHRPLIPTSGVTKEHQYYFANNNQQTASPRQLTSDAQQATGASRNGTNNFRPKYPMTARAHQGGGTENSLLNLYSDQQQ